MGDQSRKLLSGVLALQLVLLAARGTCSGALAGRVQPAGGTGPSRSPADQPTDAQPVPHVSPGTPGAHSTHEPPEAEARAPVPRWKPNDSHKDRGVARSEPTEDGAFPPRPSPAPSPDHIPAGNSSQAGPKVTPSFTPPYPSPYSSFSASSQTLEELERLAHLEVLKQTILKQLGLERPPNVTRPKPDMPEFVLNRLLREGELHNQPRRRLASSPPSQIVVFADEGNADCGPGVPVESCFRFEVPSQKTDNSVVISSHLWVYVTHAPEGASVVVNRPQHHYGGKWRVLASKKLYSHRGWLELRVPVDRHKWNRRLHYFVINTKPLPADGGNSSVSRDPGRRPLLLLAMVDGGRSSRAGRSAGMCGADANTNTCCMRDFVAEFAEMGWDSWIVAPLSFNARYCSGSCNVPIGSFRWEYSAMVAVLVQRQHSETGMRVCCVASEVSQLPVLYLGDNNNLVHQMFIDVIVEDCVCL